MGTVFFQSHSTIISHNFSAVVENSHLNEEVFGGMQVGREVQLRERTHVISETAIVRPKEGQFLVLRVCVLYYLVSSSFVLSCLVLSCLVLSCLVLSHLGLSCLVLSCLVISYNVGDVLQRAR
jgi:hypothetical protein